MTYKQVILVWRRPHLSPTEFRDEYERHMRLVRHYAGPFFPLRHTRTYLRRARPDHTGWPPLVLSGSSTYFDFDAYVEVEFTDEDAYREYKARLRVWEVDDKLRRSVEYFMDTRRTCIAEVAGTNTTY